MTVGVRRQSLLIAKYNREGELFTVSSAAVPASEDRPPLPAFAAAIRANFFLPVRRSPRRAETKGQHRSPTGHAGAADWGSSFMTASLY
jgi:hypothetical protein